MENNKWGIIKMDNAEKRIVEQQQTIRELEAEIRALHRERIEYLREILKLHDAISSFQSFHTELINTFKKNYRDYEKT